MAKVKETNADVYLHDKATIFAYNPASRMLLWARYNKKIRNWELHRNGFTLAKGHAPHVQDDAEMTTHYEMVSWARDVDDKAYRIPNRIPNRIPRDSGAYIRGRINPDKNTIYVHDLMSRSCIDDVRLGFDRHVKWALKKVGMYMKSEKNGVIDYETRTKREILYIAGQY